MKVFVPLCLGIAALFLSSCASTAVTGTAATEREAILSTLRGPVEKQLRQQTVFKVQHLKVQDGWAYLSAVPQRPGGKAMDYGQSVYQKQIELGAFEDSINALLRKRGENWTVVTYNIGATDVVWLPWAKKYGAPEAIFP